MAVELVPQLLDCSCLLLQDVLRDILSRLSIKDVVRMSTLSLEWRLLMICHPELVFTKDTFGISTDTNTDPDRDFYGIIKDMNTKRASWTAEFIANVDSVLRPLWSTSTTTTTTLDKFVVEFGLRRKHKDHIDRWVNFATASRAKHIALDFTEFTFFDSTCCKNMYIFPLCKFSGQNGSCVKSLHMADVCLKPPPRFCGITNLKKLSLHRVSIDVGDLQYLLLSCARLESISLDFCPLLSCTVRQELCRLQYLSVRECAVGTIQLQARNLES